MKHYSENRDNMMIEWDAPIIMQDGVTLRCDIFRPVREGKYPVIMSYGPYGKGLSFQQGYADSWKDMVTRFPDTAAGSTNKYQNWEVVDPEKWVPHDYVIIRVDSRGAGNSEGYLDPFSSLETKDFYECIEWAAAQDWCNGKVGLAGISYYAINQWKVAALQPPHLCAICPWEGLVDYYRDAERHGGIFNGFMVTWYEMQCERVQHGYGERGYRNPNTGELISGNETLSPEELLKNRTDLARRSTINGLITSEYYEDRACDLSKVMVPVLSCANWGGQGLHTRGNFEGYVNAASDKKWLEVHGDAHWSLFYTDYGNNLMMSFFDYFLKGIDNGWDKRKPVQLQVRRPGEIFVERFEDAWPIPDTVWTKYYLNDDHMTLLPEAPKGSSKISFDAMGEGLVFLTDPFEEETEIAGPMMAHLPISSSTEDADIFLVVRLFSAEMHEVTFQGTGDPHTPIAQGWLRASHRELDPEKSLPYRPWHPHDKLLPVVPGEKMDLEIEIVPSGVVIPKGYRLGLAVRGKDYFYAPAASGAGLGHIKAKMTGCAAFLHDHPSDRDLNNPGKFGGVTTLHIDKENAPYLLLPIIPKRK